MKGQKQPIFALNSNAFLKKLGYKPFRKSNKFFKTRLGRFILWLGIGIYLSSALGIELLLKIFQLSHLFAFTAAWIFFFIILFWNRRIKRLFEILGFDEEYPNITWYVISISLAILLALYILVSYSTQGSIPVILDFSLPVISATLAGLAISSANYPNIKVQNRSVLLRAGHKLILATCFSILFAAIFSLLILFEKKFGQVNPSELAGGKNTIIGGSLFWVSTSSLALAPLLFIQGIGLIISTLIKLRQTE